MSTLTVRNIDDETKRALRLRAARKGVSMEQEVRNILRRVARTEEEQHSGTGSDFVMSVRKLVEKYGPYDVELPPRADMADDPPLFR